MYKIEYDIKMDENGEMFVKLNDGYQDNAEDKFLVLELAKHLLNNTYSQNKYEEPENTHFLNTITFLDSVSYEIGLIIKSQMKETGDLLKNLNDTFHFKVKSLNELSEIRKPEHQIDDIIYEIYDGIKVLVEENKTVYEYSMKDNEFKEFQK